MHVYISDLASDLDKNYSSVQQWKYMSPPWNNNKNCGRRHGMPPLASNDSIGPRRFRLITWPCDLDLWVDLGDHDASGWCRPSSSICVSSLKFVGLAIRKIWRTMCVSINGPGDLDLWPWNWYANCINVGEPSTSKFGHAIHTCIQVIYNAHNVKQNGWIWGAGGR